jgi:uncharacterized protein
VRVAPGIEAFGGGGFRVAGRWIAGSLLILNDVAEPWRPTSLAEVTAADLSQVVAERAGVEFILLGVGARMAPPPKTLRQALATSGIGLETMSTPEACRLYNVLAQEGRRIAAALLMVL